MIAAKKVMNYLRLTRFRKADKKGFVDRAGNTVIELKYEDAETFSEGLAAFKINGKYGFLNRNDDVAIAPSFDYVHDFSEGLASVELNGKQGFIDRSGNEAVPIKYLFASMRFEKGLGWVHFEENKGFYVGRDGTEFYKP